MRRRRVTGRFYVFLVMLLVAGYFILRELFPPAAQEAVVTQASATYSRIVQAVIVRDEEVVGYESAGRVEYVAAEGASVKTGDLVCQVYSSGYSEKEFTRLETVRQSIRSYHEQILDNIRDDELGRLKQRVNDNAEQLKTLVRKKTGGSLLNIERQLTESMQARQDYLRQNQRQDQKLNELYREETKRVSALESWRNDAVAPREGIVSFYLDGYENVLTTEKLGSITFDEVRQILAGQKSAAAAGSRLVTNLFRVVSSDKWYIILLSSEPDWNPVSGQLITFKMSGFPDVDYAGTVVRTQKSGNDVMAQLEVVGTPGPLIGHRSGQAEIGAYVSGLSVPSRAIATQAGQTGVWLSDVPGGTFVPVEVLSQDRNNALIRPIAEGTLSVGWRVLTK